MRRAAIERDAEFVPDLSALWTTADGKLGGASNFKKVEKAFLKRLAEKRELDEDEIDRLSDALAVLFIEVGNAGRCFLT